MQPNTRDLTEEDLRILAALSKDGRISYVELGKILGITAGAAHSRVRHLTSGGRIQGYTALLGETGHQKPILAYFHINTKDAVEPVELIYLAKYPEVEELVSVTGEARYHMKARFSDTTKMERFIERIWAIEGVTSVKSFAGLSTYVDRPSQVGVSDGFEGAAPSL